MNQALSIVFSLFLLAGITVPVYAQSADHVVINEIDINPPGDDSESISEWIELYNPTDSEIDLNGWQIASTTALKKTMTINSETIEPGQFLTFSYKSVWFTDINESVELRDESGIVIDKTPILSDTQNDFTSWQRIYDGYDLDSSNNWKFVTSTSGSTNGKLIETQETEEVTVTTSSAKSSYLFGETAVIKGSVSKKVFIEKPFFQPESIAVVISGPNFDRTLTLYPDLNLNYETTLGLHQVLGIKEGNYDVSVSYAGAVANTSFSVGYETIEQEQQHDSSFSLTVDKLQYLPGEMVSIVGTATEITEFEGMKFIVTDPEGNVVYDGSLFPTNGQFTTDIFLSTVNPVYGTYEITGEYVDKSATTAFEVVEDVKESVPISLWTDKDVYGLGEVVTITGRLNDLWVASLDLEIIQTKNLALGTGDHLGGGSVLKILDVVRIDGDGKFQYSFTIPDADTRLGDYHIKVAKDVGSASKIIRAAEDPENFVPITYPLVITTNKFVYDFNLDKDLVIRGQILNPVERTSLETPTVLISFETEDGEQLSIIRVPEGINLGASGGKGSVTANYEFTAVPEIGGTFSVTADINRGIFSEGKYVIRAEYLKHTATTTFEIKDVLSVGDTTIVASLNKSVYGFGESVKLTGKYGAQGHDSQGLTITVHKPGGDIDKYGTTIDGGFFSWEWVTPVQEKTIVVERERSETPTNLGIYRVNLETESNDTNLYFKLSADPENDELVTPTLFVSTPKSLYKAGEKLLVEGTVNKKVQGTEGLVVPERVLIQVLDGVFPYPVIHESSVYPDQGGNFKNAFELPLTVFADGTYRVTAKYQGELTDHIFSVANDLSYGLDEPVELLIATDKSEYYPGDVVTVTGKPNKLIYLESYDVSVIQKSDTEITCGSFICGTHLGPITSILPNSVGSFSYEFVIPDSDSSIGTYEVTVDADFETKRIQFNVVGEPPAPKLETIIEKQNRIPDNEISVSTESKSIDDVSLSPRVVSGSLITPIRDEASNVNLKVSSESGVCIIGPDADCLVNESTRKPGQIYDVVEVDGMSLNVRYSGPDVRLEKFSILPESSESFLPDSAWNVEVLKGEQVSRFYYKVTYKASE